MNRTFLTTGVITAISCFLLFSGCNKDLNESVKGTAPVKKEMSDLERFNSNETLTRCSLYIINETSPQFKEILDEGNIAYYGLLLSAGPDRELAQKLIAANRDGLWEYQRKYGVTSEDSAIVIEGLMASGVDSGIVIKALTALSERFFDVNGGCFRTVNRGRAEYWKGCSVETTAHIAYLMHKADRKKFENEIKASAEYVRNNQDIDGKWNGKWFPSITITSYYAVRFLALFDGSFSQNIEKNLSYIAQKQSDNGSWSNSMIETSAAILLIKSSGKEAAFLSKAGDWLKNSSFKAEPVLYYWFENENHKLFFDCWDKGQISAAWKKLALDSLK